MMSLAQYEKFLSLFNVWNPSTGQRRGQWFMNKLCEVSPDTYKNLSGTSMDCFYMDSKVRVAMDYVSNQVTY